MTKLKLVDLTLPVQPERAGRATARSATWRLGRGASAYTAVVYDLAHDSMAGTYLDLPGHVLETDDGRDAASWPLQSLYRVPAEVIRLSRSDGSGGIGVDEMEAACPLPRQGRALILNALGEVRFDRIRERSVFLGREAVAWIVGLGIDLLVSDVYESQAGHGVFPALFGAGIATVCCPVNLHRLTAPRVRVTVLPLRFPGVTQLPCRVVADFR